MKPGEVWYDYAIGWTFVTLNDGTVTILSSGRVFTDPTLIDDYVKLFCKKVDPIKLRLNNQITVAQYAKILELLRDQTA